MRYFLAGFVMMFTVSVWAADASYNESVAAISYNPSRLGAYSHLKIAKEAKLKGIDACQADISGNCTIHPDVNIMTKDTVIISGGGNCTTGQACHQIENIVPMAGEEKCADFSAHCDENDFAATLQTESGTLVHGGSTPYQGNLPNIDESSYNNVTFPTVTGTNLILSGETLSAGSGSKAFVKTLSGTISKIEPPDNGSLTLIMNENAQFKVSGDNSTTFKIGNTTITVNPSKTSGNFTWKTRVDNAGTQANILALQ